MSSIYGWLSSATTPSAYHCIDSQRAASKCLTPASVHVSGRQTMAEVAGHGINAAPAVYQSPQLLVILEGTPQWQDVELAELAKTRGAAQALASGFLCYGRSVLDKIRGPFAFCLLEPDRHYALLAVDRVGIRPLAYYYNDGLLVFGSQLDQIVAHPGVNAAIDPQAIFNYLYFHMVPSPDIIL